MALTLLLNGKEADTCLLMPVLLPVLLPVQVSIWLTLEVVLLQAIDDTTGKAMVLMS